MEDELIKAFLAKYPNQFSTDDVWFWKQELRKLLREYAQVIQSLN